MRLSSFGSVGVLFAILVNVCFGRQQDNAQTISSKLSNLSEDMYMLAQEIKRVSTDNTKLTEQLSSLSIKVKASEDFRAIYEKDRATLAEKINKAIDSLSTKLTEITSILDDKVAKIKTEVDLSIDGSLKRANTAVNADIAKINASISSLSSAIKSYDVAFEEYKKAIIAIVDDKLNAMTKQLKDGMDGFSAALKPTK